MGVPEKTLITGEEILEYIPQRPPVVMVDTFYGIDERGCARSGLTVTADNLFVADGVLDECGIVEHIAQSAALRAGYMNRTMGRRVQLGYIGAVNDLKVHFPAAGEQQTRHPEHGRADGDERNASFGTDGMRRETRRRVPDENIPGRVMVRRKKSEASLVNKTSLRVRFSEVDSMQIVWHGEYVRYFEDGREAFGREFAGLGYMDIYASGYTAPIVELHLQYRKPLKVNDTAVVETRYIATEAAKVCFEYTIRSATDGEVVAEGSSTQVFLDSRGELQLLAPEFYRKWKERWEVK